MNYHTLSDFRSNSEEQFGEVIVQIVSSLMSQGLVSLERVAQDGMKVRASAGKSSFRRRETLDVCLKEAREHLAEINAITPTQWAEVTKRQNAARIRAARERVERLEEATAQCSEQHHRGRPSDEPGKRSWAAQSDDGSDREPASADVYKERSQVAEWVNAVCRNHDFRQVLVRGVEKVRSVALLHAITHDLMHGLRLQTQAAGERLRLVAAGVVEQLASVGASG